MFRHQLVRGRLRGSNYPTTGTAVFVLCAVIILEVGTNYLPQVLPCLDISLYCGHLRVSNYLPQALLYLYTVCNRWLFKLK